MANLEFHHCGDYLQLGSFYFHFYFQTCMCISECNTRVIAINQDNNISSIKAICSYVQHKIFNQYRDNSKDKIQLSVVL
jgi:hypothetical protein